MTTESETIKNVLNLLDFKYSRIEENESDLGYFIYGIDWQESEVVAYVVPYDEEDGSKTYTVYDDYSGEFIVFVTVDYTNRNKLSF